MRESFTWAGAQSPAIGGGAAPFHRSAPAFASESPEDPAGVPPSSPPAGSPPLKTAKLYPCSICGRGWPAEKMVYSTPTGQRFCPVAEWDKCVRPEDAA